MKRFSKIFSGIAAIMLGIGIILIAFSINSAKSDWERIMGAQQGFDQVERAFEGIQSIEIDLPFGYVDVGSSEDGAVHFHALNVKEDALKIRRKGNKLEIQMENGKNNLFMFSAFSFIAIGSSDWNGELAVQEYKLLLPKNYDGELEIALGTGKIRAYRVEADRMEFSVNAGELIVEECSANRLEADCDLGNCAVEGLFHDIEVKNDIGMVSVSLYASKEDYSGVIACEVGSLLYHVLGNSQEWATRSGIDLREKWESRTAKGKLKIKNDIGEVNVIFCALDTPVAQSNEGVAEMEQEVYNIQEDSGSIPEVSVVSEDTASTTTDTIVEQGVPEGSALSTTDTIVDTLDGLEY